ncbi:MAG: AAA family ATPase [Deltaproteobacteria bacterium]|nr:AAA family ATPase [Deltaproteobacteria bacterium]
MKIARVNIQGFKSFADPIEVKFEQDVTAVVGPNGCGKSNIADAIRWAMGEQSMRKLRGHSLEDVIFTGSETRGPLSMAEVTITFDNTDGLSPPSFEGVPEVAVTRRYFRDSTSEYFLNKVACRLKDIKELFMGTGAGAGAYSLIEQGRIGWIVTSRPEDKRKLIEEAAGITAYKMHKATAERKMERTQQNLSRVSDLINEIEKNLASLKRQAQKAKRYQKYHTEMVEPRTVFSSLFWYRSTCARCWRNWRTRSWSSWAPFPSGRARSRHAAGNFSPQRWSTVASRRACSRRTTGSLSWWARWSVGWRRWGTCGRELSRRPKIIGSTGNEGRFLSANVVRSRAHWARWRGGESRTSARLASSMRS